MKDINILAGATSSFGELWGVSPRKLVSDVTAEALKESGIKRHEIEAIFVGNMLSSIVDGQNQLGAFIADWVGNTYAVFRLREADDETIWTFAEKGPWVVVTKDEDFVEHVLVCVTHPLGAPRHCAQHVVVN